MIDWGWFYLITKPTFVVIDWFYRFQAPDVFRVRRTNGMQGYTL